MLCGVLFRISKVLKYEWRPGNPIENDDIHTAELTTSPAEIIPEPLQDPVPNPFDGTLPVYQGATEQINDQQQEMSYTPNQGAQQSINQGAPTGEENDDDDVIGHGNDPEEEDINLHEDRDVDAQGILDGQDEEIVFEEDSFTDSTDQDGTESSHNRKQS